LCTAGRFLKYVFVDLLPSITFPPPPEGLGEELGLADALAEGEELGESDGLLDEDGLALGLDEGLCEADDDGLVLGEDDADVEGLALGEDDGE
jgi:hypothetical protein